MYEDSKKNSSKSKTTEKDEAQTLVISSLRVGSVILFLRCDSSAFFVVSTCSAVSREMIFLPVWVSISRWVLPAMRPPCAAMVRFAATVRGFFSLEISVVVASASMLSTSLRLVMLSRRLSVFRPLYCLYCRVVMPDQPCVMMSVRVAYSCPFFTPRRSHSSVSSLRTSMDFNHWLIQLSE